MEKLPEDWLYLTLQRIEKRMDDHGNEMRAGFQQIRSDQQAHEVDDEKWKGRVSNLEERQQHRSSWTQNLHSTFIATGLLAAWEFVKHVSGWK